jgi:hypothetical protein
MIEIERGPGSHRDLSGELRWNYGLAGNCLLLVRPDGYIAVAADAGRIDLIGDWLHRWVEPARLEARA